MSDALTRVRTADGVEVAVHDSGGAGRPVVLLPGFRAPATSWRHQVADLAGAGYRTLALDIRGHGGVPTPAGSTMRSRADDLQAVLEALDLRDVALVGGSMGGNTIWAHQATYGSERVRDVVVVDQTPRMLNDAAWPHGYYGYDASNRDTYFAAGIPPTGHGTPIWRRGLRVLRTVRAMGGAPRGELSAEELGVLGDHARADWRPTIQACALPALFIAGAESELWPPPHAAAAAALAPRGSAVTIPAAGHATNMEQPERVNRVIRLFLAG